MTIWETIATERLRLADELEALTDEQWTAETQCAAWTVEELAAHTILPFEVSKGRFFLTILKNRGNFDKAFIQLTARVHAANTRTDVIRKLRENADNQWTPPKFGAEIPLSEIVVHGQDIRRPLGLPSAVPAATIELALQGIKDDEMRADYARRIGVGVPS